MGNVELVFGWVDTTVQSNHASWSNWKSWGNEEAAHEFWEKTKEEAEDKGLTWFCYDAD